MSFYDFLTIKNPKVDKEFKEISFREYILSKKINTFSIVVTKETAKFKIIKNKESTKLEIQGCLLKSPVCGKPKATFNSNFYFMREHTFSLFIEASDEMEQEYDDQKYNKVSSTNRKYSTKYTNKINNDLIYGRYYSYIPESTSFRNRNEVVIYNSHKEYINYIYDVLNNSQTELHIDIAIQDVKEWEDFFTIIDLRIDAWKSDYHGGFDEVIKGEYFNGYSSRDFPKKDNIFYYDENLVITRDDNDFF